MKQFFSVQIFTNNYNTHHLLHVTIKKMPFCIGGTKLVLPTRVDFNYTLKDRLDTGRPYDLFSQGQFRLARLNKYFLKTIHGSVKKKISKTKNVSISIKIRVDSQFGLELRKV